MSEESGHEEETDHDYVWAEALVTIKVPSKGLVPEDFHEVETIYYTMVSVEDNGGFHDGEEFLEAVSQKALLAMADSNADRCELTIVVFQGPDAIEIEAQKGTTFWVPRATTHNGINFYNPHEAYSRSEVEEMNRRNPVS